MRHSEEYIEAYRAGFYAGADCKQNFKLHMLGYEVGKLLKIIQEHEMKQNKLMTKVEAIEAHAISQQDSMREYYSDTRARSRKFIEGLEALGLIEFKKEDDLNVKIINALAKSDYSG